MDETASTGLVASRFASHRAAVALARREVHLSIHRGGVHAMALVNLSAARIVYQFKFRRIGCRCPAGSPRCLAESMEALWREELLPLRLPPVWPSRG